MERHERKVDALALFAVVLAVILLIAGPGTGFYAIAMGWPW